MLKKITFRTALLTAAFAPVCCLAAEPQPPVAATQILKTSQSWDGKPIVYPTGSSEVTALTIDIQPSAETGWHQHPIPSFAIVLEGELQVSLRDGSSRRFTRGEAFAEVVNTSHNGRNVGTTPVKLLVLYAGAAGLALTHKD